MKLSARDRQRLQWAVLGLLGGGGVLYAYVNLLVLPCIQAKADGKKQLEVLGDEISSAKLDLAKRAVVVAEYEKLRQDLAVATNRFVLRPVLGSLLESVQKIVLPLAAQTGVEIENCVERGRMEIPGAGKKEPALVFERYAMEVAVVGSYANIRDFIAAVEQTNEYVCVTDIDIQGRVESPRRHRASIRMEWPVFSERKPDPAKAAAATGGSPAGKTEDES